MTNFSDAATRHWNDGELLHRAARYDNADHLFGFAAECAIKSVVKYTGADPAVEDVEAHFRCHIDVLWNRIPVQQLSKNFPSLAALLRQENPFSNWTASQRYHATGSVPKEVTEIHRKMAQRVLGAVQLLGTRAGAKNG